MVQQQAGARLLLVMVMEDALGRSRTSPCATGAGRADQETAKVIPSRTARSPTQGKVLRICPRSPFPRSHMSTKRAEAIFAQHTSRQQCSTLHGRLTDACRRNAVRWIRASQVFPRSVGAFCASPLRVWIHGAWRVACAALPTRPRLAELVASFCGRSQWARRIRGPRWRSW